MKKKLLSLLLAAAMLFAMTACSSTSNSSTPSNAGTSTGSSAADNTAADGPVVFKIGGTGPLTGGAAIYGTRRKTAPRSLLTRSMPWAASSSICVTKTM